MSGPVCPVCLSVTLVHCGQTVRWITMKLPTEIDFGPGDFVLDGEPAPLIFGPCPLRPNGCMDQHGTWHGDRPRSKPHCAKWGPSSPPQKGDSPHFRPMSIEAKRLDGSRIKMPLGTEIGLGPGDFVLEGDPAPCPQKWGEAPNFRPMSIVSKRLNG